MDKYTIQEIATSFQMISVLSIRDAWIPKTTREISRLEQVFTILVLYDYYDSIEKFDPEYN